MLINVDSTINSELVSAEEAARVLGVKRATLYAYASRGLLARVTVGRRSAYLRSDVLRLRAKSAARAGHGAVAAGALQWGEPVLDSAITRIDPARGPIYRGEAAIDLAARGASFEEVADLLWRSSEPWPARPARPRSLSIRAFAARVVRRGFSAPFDLRRARALITDLAGGAPIARAVAPPAWSLVNAALVLVADHELNVSTFAARVTASAGASLEACVAAGLAALSGPRHGGECERFEALLDEAERARRPSAALAARMARGEALPGFGHPLYPDGDPRAPPLLRAARDPLVGAVVRAARALGLSPTIDVGLVAVAREIGAPRGTASALFALGRTAGWIAHALEQREAGYLLRPRARYVGLT